MTKINIIDLRFVYFPYEIWGLKYYLEALEKSLLFHKQEYEQFIKDKINKDKENLDESDIDIAFQEIHTMVDIVYPRTFRNSFIIQLWAAFESTMNEIAKHYYKNSKCKIKIWDIRGNFIEKIDKYFDHIVSIPFKLTRNERKKLEILYLIRNALAHGNGVLDNLPDDRIKKLKEWEKELKIFEIYTGQLILKKEYLEDSYDFINTITSRFIKRIKKEI